VFVEPGQTLKQICLRKLIGLQPKNRAAYPTLNPGLNPNYSKSVNAFGSPPGTGLNERENWDELKVRIASSEGKGI
jgi:hypothetical protein